MFDAGGSNVCSLSAADIERMFASYQLAHAYICNRTYVRCSAGGRPKLLTSNKTGISPEKVKPDRSRHTFNPEQSAAMVNPTEHMFACKGANSCNYSIWSMLGDMCIYAGQRV